ncbi:MAG TPA: hypothetical protein H9902_12310 [Candidatus Stackebrandtia faecavium]|nr:hypothetical protein [Candidatus Stackebrandtia faecavium]
MLTLIDQPVLISELPQDARGLKQWLIDVLATAPAGTMAQAAQEAEEIATQRFPAKLVVHLLRQVLSEELIGRR